MIRLGYRTAARLAIPCYRVEINPSGTRKQVPPGALVRTFQEATPASGDLFGTSVAVIGDKVLVGCPNDDTVVNDAGAVYLFDGSTGVLPKTLVDPAPFPGAHFGASLAVVGGNVVIAA